MLTEMLWVTVLALLSCGNGDRKAQKDTGAHTGKPEQVCLPPPSPWGTWNSISFSAYFMLSGRGRTTAMVSQNEVGKHYRGFEMEVKPTSFTFRSSLPPPNLEHEKENKVRPVRFLFSFFPPPKNDHLLQTGSSCQKLFIFNPLSLKKALRLWPQSHWQE